MPSGGVRVVGLREKVRSIEQMGASVGELKTAFGTIAQRAAEIAARYAPRLTGKLRRSIRGNKGKDRAIVTAGSKAREPYAGALNYGWEKRNIKGAEFMQKADDEMAPIAEKEIGEELNKLIRRYDLN